MRKADRTVGIGAGQPDN